MHGTRQQLCRRSDVQKLRHRGCIFGYRIGDLRLVGKGIALKGAYRIRTTGRLGSPEEAIPRNATAARAAVSFLRPQGTGCARATVPHDASDQLRLRPRSRHSATRTRPVRGSTGSKCAFRSNDGLRGLSRLFLWTAGAFRLRGGCVTVRDYGSGRVVWEPGLGRCWAALRLDSQSIRPISLLPIPPDYSLPHSCAGV